jgi:Tfp pilus assembly protein PilF
VLHESADPTLQATAWSELGHAHLQLHDFEQAADSYQKALHLNPEDSGASIGTGLVALRHGQFDFAVVQFFHAVKVDPSDANVLLFAQALRLAGRAVEADSALARIQRNSPDLAHAQLEAGQLLAFVGLKPH